MKRNSKTIRSGTAVKSRKAVEAQVDERVPQIADELGEEPLDDVDLFIWDDGVFAKKNYEALGKRLASTGDLYRSPVHGGGLILLLSNGKHVPINRGADLLPVIVDRVKVLVMKDGKTKGSKICSADLNAMLRSEAFLTQFVSVDQITTTPAYLPDFSLTKPGFNDGGTGHRILYVGAEPVSAGGLDTINAFLGVMAFETNADRTNAVAAALTVLLRNHWPGGKPIILATATKSHAGKDTVVSFATGLQRSVSVSYQSTGWAFERSFVGAVKTNPDAGVIVTENARLDRRDKVIASAFLERLATDPEPQLFSTGTGTPIRVRNDFVLAISTNFGSVSEDIMNRALPIHLHPVGDVAARTSPIGNPKLEFLPANREMIAAELYGMIERWKDASQPLDDQVRHPFSVWARTIGGILKHNGFTDFLANYGIRKTADDPVRLSLGFLGAARPDQWLPSPEWAKLVVDLGLTKTVIPAGDQDSEAGRVRGIGAVLSAHEAETFLVQDEETRLTLKLERKRGRMGSQPRLLFRFASAAEAESAPLN